MDIQYKVQPANTIHTINMQILHNNIHLKAMPNMTTYTYHFIRKEVALVTLLTTLSDHTI